MKFIKQFNVFLLAILAIAPNAHTFSTGAPSSVCSTMTPGHSNIDPQTGQSPFSIELDKSEVQGGETVKVILRGSRPFRGFLVQGHKQLQNYGNIQAPSGKFGASSHPGVKAVSCGNVVSGGMTHATSDDKSEIGLEWNAPNEDGDYVLLATFVEEYNTFWVKQPSKPIRVRKSVNVIEEVPAAPKLSAAAENLLNSYYDGCGFNKGCFGLPNGCIETKSCDLFTTFRVDGSKHVFQISGSLPEDSSKGYVASGLSFDPKMGADSVIGCVLEGGRVETRSYYNLQGTKNNAATSTPYHGLDGQGTGKYVDGWLFCEFKRTPTLKDENNEIGQDIDLENGQFHLIMSKASSLGPGKLGYHEQESHRGVTPQAVHMTYIGILGSKSNILTQLHGGFMIIAWLICASTGMFTARYYKQTHTDFNPFNKAFWFVLHITCMFSTVFLTICGIIFIFIEVGGYSEIPGGPGKAHPILGLILLGLAITQVIIAFFRPHPGTSKRPIFNWIHWTIGNSAHIVGIACIFLAHELPKAGLKDNFWYPLVSFVIFHVGMHVVMSIHTVWADKRMDSSNKMRAVRPGPMKPNGKSEEAPGAGFRSFMLILYLSGAALVGIIMVLLVAKVI